MQLWYVWYQWKYLIHSIYPIWHHSYLNLCHWLAFWKSGLVYALKIYTSVQCIQLAMLLLNHIFFSFALFAFFSLDHCLGSGSLDEVKVFKDEDEVDGSVTESHQAELLAEKSSLITESEQVRILLLKKIPWKLCSNVLFWLYKMGLLIITMWVSWLKLN